MVHSMTAFARVESAGTQGTLSWELRSVNHRYLEPHLRLPEALRDLTERLLEAQQRGLWQAPGDYREALEDQLLDGEEQA